ncbi:MAG: cell division protein FtsL [Pseudomonadales bacterium]|nr:cell division protein FtsL [Pseudomonadales bacterium]
MKKIAQNRKISDRGISDSDRERNAAEFFLLSPSLVVLLVLLLAVLASGLGVVYSTFENRLAMHQLQQLRNENNVLDVQWGQLLIEQSTFGLEGRIESKASEELQMSLPEWSDIIMVTYE